VSRSATLRAHIVSLLERARQCAPLTRTHLSKQVSRYSSPAPRDPLSLCVLLACAVGESTEDAPPPTLRVHSAAVLVASTNSTMPLELSLLLELHGTMQVCMRREASLNNCKRHRCTET
jgi:hypothetical protein